MKISELMTSDPVFVSTDDALIGAIAALTATDVRHLPVLDSAEEKVVGVLSERDIIAAMNPEGVLFDDEATVGQIISGEVFSLNADDTVVDAIDLLVDRKIGAAPVLDDGKLVGIVSVIDVLKAARERFS
jgi:CBS domain-containing protein